MQLRNTVCYKSPQRHVCMAQGAASSCASDVMRPALKVKHIKLLSLGTSSYVADRISLIQTRSGLIKEIQLSSKAFAAEDQRGDLGQHLWKDKPMS